MNPSNEQSEVIRSEERVALVKAFAGTGKTTVLEQYTRARPNETFLYIGYNKSVADHAKQRFGPHVRAVTAHGLAYGQVGVKFRHKLLTGDLSPSILLSALPEKIVARYDVEQRFLLAHFVIQTLQRFLTSSSDRLKREHCTFKRSENSDASFRSSDIYFLTKAVWQSMCDPMNKSIPMPHDGYLKLYQIMNPSFRADTVLFDEAQDANPAMRAIVQRQTALKRIFVGDPHQQIYAYRGAENALSEVENDLQHEARTYRLTESWRFGPKLAALASALLSTYKAETTSIHGLGEDTEIRPIEPAEPHAMLCRGNISILNYAIESLEHGLDVSVLGGIKQFDVQRLLDVYSLRFGGKVKTPLLKSLGSFQGVQEFAKRTKDHDLKHCVDLVQSRGRDILKDIDRIKKTAKTPNLKAGRVLTTVHRAKGLEWDNVVLATDFIRLLDPATQAPYPASAIPMEEINVLYVAMTRARKALSLPNHILDLVRVQWPELDRTPGPQIQPSN